MPENELSRKRRAENEVVFRQRNETIGRMTKSVLDKDSRLNLSLKFVCECSDETCHDAIEIPVDEYERVHRNSRQFLVKAGHQQRDLESVTERKGYLVVEKFESPPPTDGKLNKT